MLCARCGSFFGDVAAPIDVFCHQCDDHFYDKAFALGTYEKALAAAIVNLKVQPFLPRTVSRQIESATFTHAAFDVDVIILAPLAPMRRLERGFNQAEIIASAVSRFCGVAIDRSSLTRTTHTMIHRKGMDNKARALSVEKAFDVVRPNLIAGKKVLLVDDVLTSGSTASCCAKALKKHGATNVSVFTLARAVKHSN